MIRLSIIIPCYNAEPYIYELLDTLTAQITDEVEVILIDDGSTKPVECDIEGVTVYRQKNSGVSKARNKGIDVAKGEIISFIDADDLVSGNYVAYILNRADEEWDYMDLSWKCLENNNFNYKLFSDSDSLPNPSACTRAFKRSFVGDVRFPERKDAAEDEHFTRHLQIRKAKHICATEMMYFYRMGTPDSTTKAYMSGKKNTKRIAYYFGRVTKDMTYLIDEFKYEDETNEVFLITRENDIPELELYSQIVCPPRTVRAMESRGESNNYVNIIPIPMKTQIVIYTSAIKAVGGVESFVYNFCMCMKDHYDIMALYDEMDPGQMQRLVKFVKCLRNDPRRTIYCDTLIMNRIFDKVPDNVNYKQIVQMTHCIKQNDWHIPQNRDYIVNVSETSKESFGEEAGTVIHNLIYPEKTDKCLLLISALRVNASDKQGNDERCKQLVQMLRDAQIPFMWIYFGDKRMPNEPEGMIYGGCTLNIRSFIAKADYLVQLSGAEAFSYTMLESLTMNTPLICTDLPQNKEMGIEDGVNAYVLPLDMQGVDVNRFLEIPKFKYKYDNSNLIKKWREILGDTTPKGDYSPNSGVEIEVTREYFDLQLKETLPIRTKRTMSFDRALELVGKGLVKMI